MRVPRFGFSGAEAGFCCLQGLFLFLIRLLEHYAGF